MNEFKPAEESLVISNMAPEEINHFALLSIIDGCSECGQTSHICSCRLSDKEIQDLRDLGYTVTIGGVSAPQYIISWEAKK